MYAARISKFKCVSLVLATLLVVNLLDFHLSRLIEYYARIHSAPRGLRGKQTAFYRDRCRVAEQENAFYLNDEMVRVRDIDGSDKTEISP